MAKRKRARHAHIDRLGAGPTPAPGAPGAAAAAAQHRQRTEAEHAATVPSSAARWLVAAADGAEDDQGVPLDVVAAVLGLPAGASLRGRHEATLRPLAAAVAGLVAAGAVCPSGLPLLDLLVADADERAALTPTLDVEALLAGEQPVTSAADRAIRLAAAMTARAAQHRTGEVDLVALAAPAATPRHALADEVDTLLAVAADWSGWPPNPAPAVTVVAEGWLGASPVELFDLAASGLVIGRVADVVGEALARWFDGWSRGPDAWRLPLLARADVDADGMLHEAATRAGSDHPAVIGAILTELVALRHPIA